MKIHRKAYVILLALPLLVFQLAALSMAQSLDDVARGIRLYREGKLNEAVSVLGPAAKKQKDNADAWHILGLAQYKTGDTKSAVNSFRQAIKLRPGLTQAHTSLAVVLLSLGKMREAAREAEQAIKLDPRTLDAYYVIGAVRLWEDKPTEALKTADTVLQVDDRFAAAWLLKGQALLRTFGQQAPMLARKHTSKSDDLLRGAHEEYQRYSLLGQAADSVENYLKFTKDVSQREFWREQLDTMRFYAEWAKSRKSGDPQPLSMSGYLRPTITDKEKAKYPEAARNAGVRGTCVLKAEFAADGQIKHILVLQDPGYGLGQASVTAAQKIKFIPVVKDGKPISVVGNIEYNFSLY